MRDIAPVHAYSELSAALRTPSEKLVPGPAQGLFTLRRYEDWQGDLFLVSGRGATRLTHEELIGLAGGEEFTLAGDGLLFGRVGSTEAQTQPSTLEDRIEAMKVHELRSHAQAEIKKQDGRTVPVPVDADGLFCTAVGADATELLDFSVRVGNRELARVPISEALGKFLEIPVTD